MLVDDKTSIQSHLCLVHFFRHLFHAFLFIYLIFSWCTQRAGRAHTQCRSFCRQHFISPRRLSHKIAKRYRHELDELRLYCERNKKLLLTESIHVDCGGYEPSGSSIKNRLEGRRIRWIFSTSFSTPPNETCRSLHQLPNFRFSNENCTSSRSDEFKLKYKILERRAASKRQQHAMKQYCKKLIAFARCTHTHERRRYHTCHHDTKTNCARSSRKSSATAYNPVAAFRSLNLFYDWPFGHRIPPTSHPSSRTHHTPHIRADRNEHFCFSPILYLPFFREDIFNEPRI